MDYGVEIPPQGPIATREGVGELARRGDEMGFG